MQRHHIGDVQLLCLEKAFFGVGAFDWEEPDSIQFHSVCIPVVRILFNFHNLIGFPLLEFKRSVGNVISDAHPLSVATGDTSVLFDSAWVNRKPRIVF